MTDEELIDQVFERTSKLATQVKFVVRTYVTHPADFYRFQEAVYRDVVALRRDAVRIKDAGWRRTLLADVDDLRSTLRFLAQNGPHVEGSSVLGSSWRRSKPSRIVSGGLPGRGKRS